MASSNIKLFDENKGNMLNDTEFNISTQRLNGLQTGVASSQLQNKAMYQASLMAYAIAQLMLANGQNANDTDAVSTFVNNLLASIVQKVADKASANDVANQVTDKWVDAKLLGELKTYVADNYLPLLGGTMLGDLVLHGDPISSLQAATKQYVDKLFNIKEYVGTGTNNFDISFDIIPRVVLLKHTRIGERYDAHYATEACILLSKKSNTADLSTYSTSIIVTAAFNNKIVSITQETSSLNPLNQSGKNYIAIAFS